MPRLRKKPNGDYYVKTRIKTAFVTFQVSDPGANLLAQKGIHEGDSFDSTLLKLLIQRGFATTGGSGIAGQNIGQEEYLSSRTKMTLREESANNWRLEIHIPELSSDTLNCLDELSILDSCYIELPQNKLVSLTRLWPGSGGFSYQVTPTTKPYSFGKRGDWSEFLQKRCLAWCTQIPGLKAKGTLFLSKEGIAEKLEPGSKISPSKQYLLLTRKEEFPPDFPIRFKGTLSDWKIFEFSLSPDSLETWKNWLRKLNYIPEEQQWTVELLSSPVGLSDDNRLLLDTSFEILFAFCPPFCHQDKASCTYQLRCENQIVREFDVAATNSPWEYVVLTVEQEGRCEIRSKTLDSISFSFQSTKSKNNSSESPKPLMIEVSVDEEIHSFNAYNQRTGTIELLGDKIVFLNIDAGNNYIKEELLTLLYKAEFSFPRTYKFSEKSLDEMNQSIQDFIDSHQVFQLEVDAKNFGNLRFCLADSSKSSSSKEQEVTLDVSSPTFRRLAQLAPILASGSSSQTLLSLSSREKRLLNLALKLVNPSISQPISVVGLEYIAMIRQCVDLMEQRPYRDEGIIES